ncbi:hypothetical protein ACFP53_29060, partial [Streptomyces zhihengii]
MVTFAQAQERAEEWVNGEVPAYQHREVRVREFDLGFVVWAEDREGGARSDGGQQRLVIARDSGEATLWPGLPVGEVIRRYEEEYGARAAQAAPAAGEAPERIDLNQTSFLLSPPEWLQEAADRLGIPDRRDRSLAGQSATDGAGAPSGDPAPAPAAVSPAAPAPAAATPAAGSPSAAAASATPWPAAGDSGAGAAPVWPDAGADDHEPTASDGVPATPSGRTGWTDTSAGDGGDASVPLPATVFAPPLNPDAPPPPSVSADAPTALMSGGSALPRTTVSPALGAGTPPPDAPTADATPPPGLTPRGNADVADAATTKAVRPPRGARPAWGGATPPPP